MVLPEHENILNKNESDFESKSVIEENSVKMNLNPRV
jgi:hypothetical protein